MTFEVLDADAVRRRITPGAAIEALRQRILHDPPRPDRPLRTRVPVDHGQLLLMPDQGDRHVGVKVVSLAPGNPALGRPAVQGVYLLTDAVTLTPLVVLDAAELTLVRTAAVTLLGVQHLRPVSAPTVVVVGSGPQAVAHAEAAAALQPAAVTVLARSTSSARRVSALLAERAVAADVSTTHDLGLADVILCCTSAAEPLLTRDELRHDVVVAAVGSHEPGMRELPTALMADAFVCVESAEVARREAGDVILAESELDRPVIDIDLPALVRPGAATPSTGRRVLKTVGEAWQDLAVAAVAIG